MADYNRVHSTGWDVTLHGGDKCVLVDGVKGGSPHAPVWASRLSPPVAYWLQPNAPWGHFRRVSRGRALPADPVPVGVGVQTIITSHHSLLQSSVWICYSDRSMLLRIV